MSDKNKNDELNEEALDAVIGMLNRYHKGEASPLDVIFLVNVLNLDLPDIKQRNVTSLKGETTMHCHTTWSDGSESPLEVIYLAKLIGLESLVIADHDCIDAYLDPEVLKAFEETGIKTIPACEMVCAYEDVGIEILAYGVDPVKMKAYLDEHGITQNALERYRSEMVPKAFARHGIILDYDPSQIDFSLKDPRVLPALFESIKRNPDAVKLLMEENPEMLESTGNLLRAGLNNPKSKIFIEPNSIYPQYDKIAKLIHDMGGVAVLAHPYQYKKEMQRVLDGVVGHVDGIECYHFTSEDPERIQFLKNFAKKYNLLVTGGTDYHGLLSKGGKNKLSAGVPIEYFYSVVNAVNERQGINQPS